MRPVTDTQAREWIDLAFELAEQQTEAPRSCSCATCLTLVALNDTRRETSDGPKVRTR